MNYSMVVEWYAPGNIFIVRVPELAERVSQPIAEGKTRGEAVFNAEDMLETLIEVANERSDPLPEPLIVTA